MSTIMEVNNYQFKMYRRDTPPAHTHVKCDGKEVIIILGQPMIVTNNWGFDEMEIAEILDIIEQRGGRFIYGHWDRYHLQR